MTHGQLRGDAVSRSGCVFVSVTKWEVCSGIMAWEMLKEKRMQEPFPNEEQVAQQAGKQIQFPDDQTRMDSAMDSFHTVHHVRWRWTVPVQDTIDQDELPSLSVLFEELCYTSQESPFVL